MEMEWIGDDGPLVLLAKAEAPSWLGAWREATDDDDDDDLEEVGGKHLAFEPDLDEDEPPRTDYARACAGLEPPALAALIPFAGGTALALETTGHQAAFVAAPEGVVIAKWVFAPSEDAANAALAALPREIAWRSTGITWNVPSPGVWLQPAAERFEGDGVAFKLAEGRYAVETSVFEPDEETSFELWRLRSAG